MNSAEKIAAALMNALEKSEDPHPLFEALREFRTKYGRSYEGVRKHPFLRRLIEAIEDAEFKINEEGH